MFSQLLVSYWNDQSDIHFYFAGVAAGLVRGTGVCFSKWLAIVQRSFIPGCFEKSVELLVFHVGGRSAQTPYFFAGWLNPFGHAFCNRRNLVSCGDIHFAACALICFARSLSMSGA